MDKFEHSLALSCTAGSVQDKDMLLPQIIKKIFFYFGEKVLSSGKESGRSRAAFRVSLPADDPATFTQQLRQRMINTNLGPAY